MNARVQDLIARMSTEEKVAQLLNPFTSAKAILQKYRLRVMASIQAEILTWLRFPYSFESWDA